MWIFPDKFNVLESIREGLVEIFGCLPTNAERVKETFDIHGTLTTPCRDVNRLLERSGTR